MAYNTVKVWAAYEVLGSSDLNNNMANLDFLKTQVIIRTAQGRLTLESGVPVSTSDQTGKTTLYYAPFCGNKIGLYDSGAATWDLYTFSETSLSLSGLIKGVVYDIFGYLSGGALALESLAWKKVTATNNPSSGSSVVINISYTTGLVVGQEVTIKDGSNSEVGVISAINSGVSITIATLANSYTTPEIYGFPERETSLTLSSGVYTKSGDTTRRYLGTIRINRANTGQCEDTQAERYVWNYDNQVERKLYCKETTASWPWGSTWHEANGGSTYGTSRVGVVIGLSINEVVVQGQVLRKSGTVTGTLSSMGIGIDNSTTNIADLYCGYVTTELTPSVAKYRGYPGIGAHSIRWLEYSNGYATTFYSGTTTGYSGLIGSIMA